MTAPATVLTVAMTPETRRKLRTASRKIREWTEERNRLIRQAHTEKASLQKIADEVGMTDVGVMKVIRRGAGSTEDAVEPDDSLLEERAAAARQEHADDRDRPQG